jgi:hypothetical protein
MIGGDFNNDGKADLALLALDSSNTFSPLYVLTSKGDGTFQPNLVENVPGIATSLAEGDFNHDGNLDIAVTAPRGAVNPSVLVFLGRGDGTFTGPISYSTGTLFTNDVKAADFNGDGKIDLAVGTEQGIFFFAGKGDGTFQAPVETSTPFSVIRTSLGDFNGDGKPDLAITGNGDLSVSIAIGNGDGTFQTPLPFEATYYPRGFTAGDFNGDGSLDLMQFSASNTLNVSPQTASTWLSTPTIVFSAPGLDFGTQDIGTSSPPMSIALTNQGNKPLTIARSTTSGNFTETDNCVSTFTGGQGCTLNVTFTPAANGASSGDLTLVDNAKPGSQSLTLTGWSGPPDFSLAAAPSVQSVAPGSDTTYNVTLAAGGEFSGTVQLTCTGVPSQATCVVSKSSVALDESSPVNVKVAVHTTAPSVAAISRRGQLKSRESRFSLYWIFCLAPVAVLLMARKLRTVTTIGTGVLALALISCGGGGSSGGGGGGGGNPGTPPGTYSITLSGASGSTTHAITITLKVT